MAGMLQILTYMFGIYLVIKGVEVLQIALMSSRPSRLVGLVVGGITLALCILSAATLVFLQDLQAKSLNQPSISSLTSEHDSSRSTLWNDTESPSRDYIAPPPLNPSPPRAQIKAADAIKQARELMGKGQAATAYNIAHQGQSDPDATRNEVLRLQEIADEAIRRR